MERVGIFLATLLCYHILFFDRVQPRRDLFKEKDVDMGVKLKSLDMASINNIQDKSGDIYDCVDIYKQLAFQHPLLQNHTIDFQMISKSFDEHSKPEMCPVGKIPIRKITRPNLTRESQVLEAKKTETTNRPNTFLAIARTKTGPSKYAGGGGELKTNSIKAVGQQYSATRIRIQGGADSIEAGWRVDPALYGDSQTRFFIRTDAGRTHCFNTRCPGFIQTYSHFNLEGPLEEISPTGGPTWTLPCHIIRDFANGNWNLVLGNDGTIIGYWPFDIFTGLIGLADRVEWGGAAHSSPGTSLPPMGSGNHPIGSMDWNGTVTNIQVIHESGKAGVASDIETYADDPKLYSVRDGGYPDKRWGHVILYGGPGHL